MHSNDVRPLCVNQDLVGAKHPNEMFNKGFWAAVETLNNNRWKNSKSNCWRQELPSFVIGFLEISCEINKGH